MSNPDPLLDLLENPAPLPRRFYKCGLCLGAFAVEGERLPYNAECDCGGTLSGMGLVKRDRLTEGYIGTPCDHRCTMAAGPSCDCKCGGENHGSQALVIMTRDLGAVPRMASGSIDHEKRHARRDEYLEAKREAESLRDSVGGDNGSYWAPSPRRKLVAAIRKSERSKAHHHRMKLLRDAMTIARGADQ